MEEHIYKPDPKRDKESYDLIGSFPDAPTLPGHVTVAESSDEVIDAIARDLVSVALDCVRDYGDFHLALSGGKTPQPLYERLMYDPDYRALPWRRTHLWIVDERCVPLTHEDSNYRMIAETIVQHADLPSEQVHPIEAESSSVVQAYETQIRESLEWREKGNDRIDFILLGMGADGHTAGLFPHTPALAETERWMSFNSCSDAQPSERVTMTFPLINSARFIAVLVTGSAKAEMIQRVASGEESIEELPIQGVSPIEGELRWYLDPEACAGFSV